MKLLLLTTKEKASLNFEPKFPILIVGNPDVCMYVFVYPFKMVDNWWMYPFSLKVPLNFLQTLSKVWTLRWLAAEFRN